MVTSKIHSSELLWDFLVLFFNELLKTHTHYELQIDIMTKTKNEFIPPSLKTLTGNTLKKSKVF